MDVVMPQLGETVTEGTVTRWHKKVGEAVRADEALFDVETDKVSTEIPAPANGVLEQILVAEGTTAKVGTRLAVIREPGAQPLQPAPAAAAPPAAAEEARAPLQAERARGRERLSPVVRRLLAQHGLDASAIAGSGREGRITREDVLAHLARRAAQPVAGSEERPRSGTAEEVAQPEPLSRVRRHTAEHMARAWAAVPHVAQAVEVDFHRVESARAAAGKAWREREGFALTYLPFVARAVAETLARFPRLNAVFAGDHLMLHRRVNLGIAVDLGFEGLVVPVVKDAGSKSVAAIARELNELAARARANRLRPDDVSGATYTITNNGAFGTLFTAPIVNHPQVAILSTDAVRRKPVVVETEAGEAIAIRPLGVLAQSVDHRAVDGAYAAAFLRELKRLLETQDWLQALGV